MGWNKRLVLLKISKYAIFVSLILSIIFAAFTLYGNKVGNFVIQVQGGEHSLTLNDTEDILLGDYSKNTTTLFEDGLTDMVNCSFYNIPSNIYEGVGSKNDTKKKQYLAYSFYLLNTSDSIIDYTMQINIIEVSNNVDAAIRVMVIEGENESRNIYAKVEESEENRIFVETNTQYQVTDYFNEKSVCLKQSNDFESSSYKKYTIVIWLEGWDKDTNNNIIDGAIRMSMIFNVL